MNAKINCFYDMIPTVFERSMIVQPDKVDLTSLLMLRLSIFIPNVYMYILGIIQAHIHASIVLAELVYKRNTSSRLQNAV
jgi:hypothetical protein